MTGLAVPHPGHEQRTDGTIRGTAAEHFVIVSQNRFDDNYYSSGNGGVAALALGNWKRALAPPSFVEFVQALLVREAVGALCPSLTGSVHLGTKRCLLVEVPDHAR